jgi:hypothetical protein
MAASSTASSPAELVAGGMLLMRGRCAPSTSGFSALSKVIELVSLLVDRDQLTQTVHGFLEPAEGHRLRRCAVSGFVDQSRHGKTAGSEGRTGEVVGHARQVGGDSGGDLTSCGWSG